MFQRNCLLETGWGELQPHQPSEVTAKEFNPYKVVPGLLASWPPGLCRCCSFGQEFPAPLLLHEALSVPEDGPGPLRSAPRADLTVVGALVLSTSWGAPAVW